MERKYLILIVIIALILILGFIGGLIKKPIVFCTLKGCFCPEGVSEVECNSCGESKFVFYTFIINLAKYCDAQEIVLCENGEVTGERIDIYEDSCEYRFTLLGDY